MENPPCQLLTRGFLIVRVEITLVGHGLIRVTGHPKARPKPLLALGLGRSLDVRTARDSACFSLLG